MTSPPGAGHILPATMSVQEPLPIDRKAQVRRAPQVLGTEIHGEMVIIDTDRGVYLNLNDIGTHIWNLIDAPMCVDEIVASLSRDYDAAADVIERDVLAFLHQLRTRNLVTIA